MLGVANNYDRAGIVVAVAVIAIGPSAEGGVSSALGNVALIDGNVSANWKQDARNQKQKKRAIKKAHTHCVDELKAATAHYAATAFVVDDGGGSGGDNDNDDKYGDNVKIMHAPQGTSPNVE